MHFVNGMHLWLSLVSVTFKMGITHAHISAWKHTWCCSQTMQEVSAVLCKLKTASEKSLNCASLHTTHSCPACVLKYNRSVSLRNIEQCSLHSVLYLVWFEGKLISWDWPPCHHSRTDSVSRKPPDPSVHPPRSEIIRLPKMELCLWHHVSFQLFLTGAFTIFIILFYLFLHLLVMFKCTVRFYWTYTVLNAQMDYEYVYMLYIVWTPGICPQILSYVLHMRSADHHALSD